MLANMRRACSLLSVAAEAAGGTRGSPPHQDSQLVAQVEQQARLLVMGQADEIGATSLTSCISLRMRSPVIAAPGRVVFVPLGAGRNSFSAVQMEDAVFGELEIAQAEELFDAMLAVRALQSDGAGVQIGIPLTTAPAWARRTTRWVGCPSRAPAISPTNRPPCPRVEYARLIAGCRETWG